MKYYDVKDICGGFHNVHAKTYNVLGSGVTEFLDDNDKTAKVFMTSNIISIELVGYDSNNDSVNVNN